MWTPCSRRSSLPQTSLQRKLRNPHACLHTSVAELTANKGHIRVISHSCHTQATYSVKVWIRLLQLDLQCSLERFAELQALHQASKHGRFSIWTALALVLQSRSTCFAGVTKPYGRRHDQAEWDQVLTIAVTYSVALKHKAKGHLPRLCSHVAGRADRHGQLASHSQKSGQGSQCCLQAPEGPSVPSCWQQPSIRSFHGKCFEVGEQCVR